MFLKLLLFVTVYVIVRGQGYNFGRDVCRRLEQCPSMACQDAASAMHQYGGNRILNNFVAQHGGTINVFNKLKGAARAKKMFRFIITKISAAFGPDVKRESKELITKTMIEVLKERANKETLNNQADMQYESPSQGPNNYKRLCLFSPPNDYCVTQTKGGSEVLTLRSSLMMYE